MIKIEKTERGFSVAYFKDANGEECSVQMSSAIRDESLLWLGCDNIGIKTLGKNGQGCKSFPDSVLPEFFESRSVLVNNRMHLTQSQVRELLPLLTKFAETGEF